MEFLNEYDEFGIYLDNIRRPNFFIRKYRQWISKFGK